MQNDTYVCVIGGANVDISGFASSALVQNDSNIGKITSSCGGVARNIAENLAKLDIKVELITALGNDQWGNQILENCKKNKISTYHSLKLSTEHTSVHTSMYLNIQDKIGQLQLAVSDMKIIDNITPAFLSQKLDIINSARACVIDTNVPKESIQYIKQHCNIPVFLDTVSVAKTKKCIDAINDLYAIKPNLTEAEIISGIKIQKGDSKTDLTEAEFKKLRSAAHVIISKNIRKVFISTGKNGVYYASKEEEGYLPKISIPVVSEQGAGDAFTSGVIWAYCQQKSSLKELALSGTAAAAICLSSPFAISENLSNKTLLSKLELIRGIVNKEQCI